VQSKNRNETITQLKYKNKAVNGLSQTSHKVWTCMTTADFSLVCFKTDANHFGVRHKNQKQTFAKIMCLLCTISLC